MSQYGRNVSRKKLTTAQFQACFRFILILVVEDHITDLAGCKILILLTGELFNQKLSQNQLPSLVLSFSSRYLKAGLWWSLHHHHLHLTSSSSGYFSIMLSR